MNDFIFGTLATDELRRKRDLELRSGVVHHADRSPVDPLPAQPIELRLSVGPTQPGTRAWVYWATDSSDPVAREGSPQVGNATPMEVVGETWDTVLWGYVRHFRAILPGQAAGTLLRYRISSWSAEQGEVFADGGAYYAVYIDQDPLPAWTKDAIIYQVFVDRYNPGDGRSWQSPENPAGFYGGTLLGVVEKLDDIQDLGFNTLWLTPVFPSPSHHGYDATDLFDIEPRLGTRKDMRLLLDEAHLRGIRVLLDLVPNHISNQHPLFQEAIRDVDSPYRDWFMFYEWPSRYESFFGVAELPQLNLRNPGARKYMLDAARFWLEMGVDGFRVDYAIGPTPDFWAELRKTTRAVRPDCWTFGEVVDPPDSQIAFTGALDGCLDFMLLEALRQTFAFGRWSASRFAAFLDRHEAFFPSSFSRPSFLDNHDMNRFLWAAGGDSRRLKLAALCQFTLSGPPVVYYGTEVGLSQERDVRQGEFGLPEESRLPMLWDNLQNLDLQTFYRRLIALRHLAPALKRGIRKTLLADDAVLVYRSKDETESFLTALNIGSSERDLSIDTCWNRVLLTTSDDVTLQPGMGAILRLPPLSGAVLASVRD